MSGRSHSHLMAMDQETFRHAAESDAHVRLCDHDGCDAPAEFRAPKSPDKLNEHYWFCLEHVREYNAAWNYCDGLSDEEVEARVRADTVWHRPTWPLGGGRHFSEEMLRAEALAFGKLGQKPDPRANGSGTANQNGSGPGKDKHERRALSDLNLSAPVTFSEVRARYIELVKRLHPDANGGSQAREDRLKTINRAYALLRERYG